MKTQIIFLLLFFAIGSSFQSSVRKTDFKTLKFLSAISGSKTIAGIHNREPNAIPDQWTNEVFKLTGKYPSLWSGDFLFQEENIANQQTMIDEALKQWQKGAIVNIMWHACNPALNEPCSWNKEGVLSHLSDEQWKEITTDGTVLNKEWKSRVDEVSIYLKYLQDRGVEVLWRPMHEMNQGVFWWGGRPGPDGTRKLFQMLHDYMTNKKGLTNLVWIWDIQDFETLESDAEQYNPGDEYWDILALDVYDGKSGFSRENYDIIVKASKGKPIAIGECAIIPTVDDLINQPKWTFFMGWSELEFEKNSQELIKSIHTAENVITLDEMPGWN